MVRSVAKWVKRLAFDAVALCLLMAACEQTVATLPPIEENSSVVPAAVRARGAYHTRVDMPSTLSAGESGNPSRISPLPREAPSPPAGGGAIESAPDASSPEDASPERMKRHAGEDVVAL